MIFDYTDKTKGLIERVRAFMDEHVYPNEARYEQEVAEGERWKVLPVIEELKPHGQGCRACGTCSSTSPITTPVNGKAPA